MLYFNTNQIQRLNSTEVTAAHVFFSVSERYLVVELSQRFSVGRDVDLSLLAVTFLSLILWTQIYKYI